MKALLRLEVFGDNHEGPLGMRLPQQNGQKRLGRLRHAVAGQQASLLQALGKGLHNGSFECSSEQIACRGIYSMVRQAGATLQPPAAKSSAAGLLGWQQIERHFSEAADPELLVGVAAVEDGARVEPDPQAMPAGVISETRLD